jgi:hypothetical protein
MSRKVPSYYYVTNKETHQQAYRIGEGKFSGIVWSYHNVKFPMYTDEGEMVDPSKAEEIPLTFDCELMYNPTDEDLSTGEFEATVGDILMNIIDESLKNDTVKFRSDDTDESDI